MIGYVKGTVEDIGEDQAVVDWNNMGLNIKMSTINLSTLPRDGKEVKIYTYMYVKEDQMSLFGFLTKQELNIFKMLITVNGVGPKVALAVLSAVSASDFLLAIASEDAKTIAKAKGVSIKTAQKIILELKGKLDNVGVFTTADSGLGKAIADLNAGLDTAKEDALAAIVELGYDRADGIKALSQVETDESRDSGWYLSQALKKLVSM